MITLFHDMMQKEIEVYMDDLITKSQEKENHVENFWKLFERLRKFQLKLNPAKCTFSTTFWKLLGFVVNKRGIEVDPDKIQTIQNFPPSCTQKEVQIFFLRIELHLLFYLTDDGNMQSHFQTTPKTWLGKVGRRILDSFRQNQRLFIYPSNFGATYS